MPHACGAWLVLQGSRPSNGRLFPVSLATSRCGLEGGSRVLVREPPADAGRLPWRSDPIEIRLSENNRQ